jgi:hypothetical protein
MLSIQRQTAEPVSTRVDDLRQGRFAAKTDKTLHRSENDAMGSKI